MFSVSSWKVITVLTSVRISWQSRCLYLALSIMHSICTFISCFVSFSHMLSQALSFCLFPQYLSDGHSIRSHHRNLLALRKLMANLITVATWQGNTNPVCLIQTGKVGERTWNEMRPQVMVSTYQLPHLSQCSPQSTAHYIPAALFLALGRDITLNPQWTERTTLSPDSLRQSL